MQNDVTFVVFMNMRESGDFFEPYQIIGPMFDLALAHDSWPDTDRFPTYCASDFNRDCLTDTRDLLDYLNVYTNGCR